MEKFLFKKIIYFLLFLQFTKSLKLKDIGSIAGKWKVKYGLQNNVSVLCVNTNTEINLPLEIYNIERNGLETNNIFFEFVIVNTKIATVEKRLNIHDIGNDAWQGIVTVKGHYFGYTQMHVTLNDPATNRIERSDEMMDVKVVRNNRIDINIYNYSAVFIMLLMFVNLGTVLDLERMRLIFVRPIGPLLGFSFRYIIMPGLAIGLGVLVFPNNKNLRLALLFTSMAPSGGIANICNVFLKGNINLSLAITTLNSILALGMLPLWIFLMGLALCEDSNLNLPFTELAVGGIVLVLALTTGVLLRIFLPKQTSLIFRFLKPISVFLSLCLIGVTVGINAFAFKEVTLKIFLVSLFVPIIGYIIAFILSKLLCRTTTDAMTIAVETSVLNMSLPIVLLEYTLEQPMADMLVVLPILSALMSLCLVIIFYIVRHLFGWNAKHDVEAFDDETYLVK